MIQYCFAQKKNDDESKTKYPLLQNPINTFFYKLIISYY